MRYLKLLLIAGTLLTTSCEKDCMTADAIIDMYSQMIQDAEGNTQQQMELQAQMMRELENACD